MFVDLRQKKEKKEMHRNMVLMCCVGCCKKYVLNKTIDKSILNKF